MEFYTMATAHVSWDQCLLALICRRLEQNAVSFSVFGFQFISSQLLLTQPSVPIVQRVGLRVQL